MIKQLLRVTVPVLAPQDYHYRLVAILGYGAHQALSRCFRGSGLDAICARIRGQQEVAIPQLVSGGGVNLGRNDLPELRIGQGGFRNPR